MMDNKLPREIPYGISDYVRITRDNYYYVDKTHFIPRIEQAASFFFLIRPRRFGKSLMLTMLDTYYDINNEARFEELFGNRWIFRNPTKLRAKFLILRFNFSAVDSRLDRMERSFESHCSMRFLEFAGRYKRLFDDDFEERLNELPTAADKLQYIDRIASSLGHRIYLVIDEYDNFTNSILASLGKDAYRQATHGEGFFRYFFNVIKSITTAPDAALERLFITGVSPITLDDVTSGFNIGSNYTTDPDFNALVGFSEEELHTMLEYYHSEGALSMDIDEMMTDMKPWYDNYCFAEESLGEYMYNSDMVLYYVRHCLQKGYPPKEMIDYNIRTDYNKLRHLLETDKKLGDGFSVLREVIETGHTTAMLSSSFSVENMVRPDNFKSLLYYFGLLSIKGSEAGEVILGIPNHVVREQMYSYLVAGFEDTDIFRIDLEKLRRLMKTMAYEADWQPAFRFMANEIEKQSRVRQYIDGEAHIKGFLSAYFGLTLYYLTLPEHELAKGYADFYFQPNPRINDIRYGYLVEIKYLKRDEPDSRIEEKLNEARKQLEQYSSDPMIEYTLGIAELKRIAVVFRGWEIAGFLEV